MQLYPPEPGKPAKRGEARGRFALALAGALVAHGLLALLLWRSHPPAAPKKGADVPVEVRFETVPANPPASATARAGATSPGAAAPAGPPASTRASQRVAAADALAHAAPVRATPAEEAHQLAPSATRPSAARKHDEAWAAAEGLLLAPQSSKTAPPLFGVTRTLKDPLASLGKGSPADRPGAGTFDNGFGEGPQGPVRVPTREEALAEEKARGEARVKSWLIDEQAIARADPTRDRDGYWQDVQDALEKGFAPDWSLLGAQPGHAGPHAPKAVGVVTEQYLKTAQTYGKTGTPFSAPDAPGAPGDSMNHDLGSALAVDRGLSGTALESTQSLVMAQLGAAAQTSGHGSPWAQSLIVHVLLTQRPDGGLIDVTLAGSSGNAVYDALVLGQARKLSAHGLLGAPPKDHTKTIWAFETDFLQAPPLPVAGCGLDGFMPSNCFYPFKQSVKSRVRLEAVY